MSETAGKTRLSQIYDEVINARQLDQADEFFASDLVEREALPGAEGHKGIQAYKQYLTTIFNAFPDYHENVEEIIAEEDNAMVRFTATGTQHGELLGLAPTGKGISIQGIDIYHLAHGKIAEHRRYLDAAGLMQQLIGFPLSGQTVPSPTAMLPTAQARA
jgi:steroid delta-isomerase-like uncharacterized protein